MPARIFLLLLWAVSVALPPAVSANEVEWLIADGQAALGADDAGKALSIAEAGLQKFPDDTRLAYLAGVAAEREGRADRALELLTKLDTPALRAAFAGLDFAMGRALFAKGDFAKAEKRFSDYLSSSPGDASAFVWLGESQLRQDKSEEAFKSFARAGKPEPRFRPVFHFSRAMRVFGSNPDEAVAELGKAIATDKTGPVAPRAQSFIELTQKKEEFERWYSIDGALGFQADSNMLLNTKGDGSLKYAGNRMVVSLAAFARPRITDQISVGVGANLNQAQTLSVAAEGQTGDKEPPKLAASKFNLGSHTLFLDGSYYKALSTSAIEPGLEYALHWGSLGGSTLDLSHLVSPRLTWFHTAEHATKFYALAGYESWSDVTDLAPLASSRSGTVFGGGAAHYWVFDGRLDALTAFAEYVAKQSDQPYAGPRLGVNGRKRIVADLYVDAGVLASQRSYSGDGAHPAELLVGADGGVGYLLFNHLEIDLNAGYVTNQTDEAYAYDRTLFGVFIRGIF
jgi:tetratricopeptide (TPR) repeat protein